MHFDRCHRIAHSGPTPSLLPSPLPSTRKAGKLAYLPSFPHNQGGHMAWFGHRYSKVLGENIYSYRKRWSFVERRFLHISFLPAWEQATVNHMDERSTLSLTRGSTGDDMDGTGPKLPILGALITYGKQTSVWYEAAVLKFMFQTITRNPMDS